MSAEKFSDFCCIAFGTNQLTLIEYNEKVAQIIRSSFTRYFELFREQLFEDSVEFTLNGYPWQPRHFEELGQGVNVLLEMLKNLALAGYRNVTCHRVKFEKDSMHIEYNGKENATYHFIGILFQGTDGIMLVDAPMEIEQMMLKLFTSFNEPIKALGIKLKCGRYRVNSHLWTEGDPTKIRSLLSQFQFELRKSGFVLVCNTNLWGQDTWILRKSIIKTAKSNMSSSQEDVLKSVEELDAIVPKKNSFRLDKINKAKIISKVLPEHRPSNAKSQLSSPVIDLDELYSRLTLDSDSSEHSSKQNTFGSVSIIGIDSLWIINFPSHVKLQLRNDIFAAWTPGITSDIDVCVKLNGSPWTLNDQDISGIELICEIIKSLGKQGYKPVIATNTCKKQKDMILFAPVGVYAPKLFSIAFFNSDKMIFSNAPSSVVDVCKKNVTADWFGIQQERQGKNILELKLHGNPFGIDDNERTRFVLTNILTNILELRCRFVASINITGQETWIFDEAIQEQLE